VRPRVRHTRPVARNEPPHRTHDADEETTSRIPPEGRGLRDVRDPLPDGIRDPSFPAAIRGYDRRAVDAYVEQVNGLIAELQVSGSPQAAVRHALERVGEQTSGILQHARETAEEITKSAREEAEETTARAKAEAQDITTAAQGQASEAIARARDEADELVARARTEANQILARANEQSETTLAQARVEAEERTRQVEQEIASLREDAESRIRSLQADIATISNERGTLLDEVRRIAARLEAIAAGAEPAEDPAADGPETPEPPAAVTNNAPLRAGPNGADAQHQQRHATGSSPET
jgi:DivIVA domain-containing protein